MELLSELFAPDIFSLLEGLYFAAPPYLLIFTPVKSYENKLTHNSLLMTEIEECRKQSLK